MSMGPHFQNKKKEEEKNMFQKLNFILVQSFDPKMTLVVIRVKS